MVLTAYMSFKFELTDYHWQEKCMSSITVQEPLEFKYCVNIDMAGTCQLWNRRHIIRGCEIDGDTSTKSSVCIMSTVDL